MNNRLEDFLENNPGNLKYSFRSILEPKKNELSKTQNILEKEQRVLKKIMRIASFFLFALFLTCTIFYVLPSSSLDFELLGGDLKNSFGFIAAISLAGAVILFRK